MLYTYSNISDPSDYIMDNAYLEFNPLQTFMKENIFFSAYLYSSSTDLSDFILYLIT